MKGVVMTILLLIAGNALLHAEADSLRYSNALVVTAEELREGVYGYDLFDVLAALWNKAGITVKSSSDVGAEDWLLIRGYPRDSGRNVLVLIDGMPLNDGLSGANEFAHLPPIELIEKIIVYRPPLPARFGGAHAAVEIVTRQTVKEYRSEVSGGYGQYQSLLGALQTQGRLGNLQYQILVDYLRTANLTGVRRTPPKENLVYGDRSYWIAKPAGKISYKVGAHSNISLFVQYVKSYKLFSDQIFRDQKEFRERDLSMVNLNYRLILGNRFTLTSALFRTDETYLLNLKQHPTVRDQKRVVQGTKVDAFLALPGNHRLSAGVFFLDNNARERLASPLALTRTTILGVYLENRWQPIQKVGITLGLRYDDHSETTGRWNPSVALELQPLERLTLQGRWSRSTRWPGLSEFAIQEPSQKLQGEQMQGYDVGFHWRMIPRRVTMRLTYFHLTLENESRFVLDFSPPFPRAYYQNADDRIQSRGVELEAHWNWSRHWKGYLNYTFNEVRRRPSGTPLAYSPPRNLLNSGITYSRRQFLGKIEVRYGGEAQGVQAMRGRPTVLESWLLIDLAFQLRLTKQFHLLGHISNITDQTYETFDGRPMFGRTAILGARMMF